MRVDLGALREVPLGDVRLGVPEIHLQVLGSRQGLGYGRVQPKESRQESALCAPPFELSSSIQRWIASQLVFTSWISNGAPLHGWIPPCINGCSQEERQRAAAGSSRQGWEGSRETRAVRGGAVFFTWPLASLSGFHVEGRRVNILCQVQKLHEGSTEAISVHQQLAHTAHRTRQHRRAQYSFARKPRRAEPAGSPTRGLGQPLPNQGRSKACVHPDPQAH